jgi:hypothetical protein
MQRLGDATVSRLYVISLWYLVKPHAPGLIRWPGHRIIRKAFWFL